MTLALVCVQPVGAGTIHGRVDAGDPPPRRSAQRYPNSTGEVARAVGVVPTVVFLAGPVAGASAAEMPRSSTISQRNTEFVPGLAVVPVGATVSFPNEDDEYHNVFSYSRTKRFDLGRYPKGETKSVVFDHTGVAKIYCEIHPWMRAAVVVVDNPFFAVADDDGTFTIEGVPPGRHRLVIWNIDRGSRDVEVEVTGTGQTEVEVALNGDFLSRVQEERLVVAGRTTGADAGEGCCAGGSG